MYVVTCNERVLAVQRRIRNARKVAGRYQGARILRIDPDGPEVTLRAARPSAGPVVFHGWEVI